MTIGVDFGQMGAESSPETKKPHELLEGRGLETSTRHPKTAIAGLQRARLGRPRDVQARQIMEQRLQIPVGNDRFRDRQKGSALRAGGKLRNLSSEVAHAEITLPD